MLSNRKVISRVVSIMMTCFAFVLIAQGAATIRTGTYHYQTYKGIVFGPFAILIGIFILEAVS